MSSWEILAANARALRGEVFQEKYGRWFLVCVGEHAPLRAEQNLEFHTTIADSPLRRRGSTAPLRPQIIPVIKKTGNPYPERISLGRARASDIVIRVAHVSKLHAHFLVGERAALALVDQRSANGTFVNGNQLIPGRACLLTSRARLSFGGFTCELVSGEELISRLLRG